MRSLAAGDVLTDDEIAEMEAQEDAAKAKAAAAGSDASDGVETGDDDQGATARATPAVAAGGGAAQMQPMTVQFVLGHLTVGRLASWGEARSWSASDPIERGGGYGGGAHLHQWMVLDEPALRVVPTGQFRRSFAIHCLDQPASAELRAKTREAHIEWLRASGRVQLAGPLLAPPSAAEAAEAADAGGVGVGARVGSLLIVSGDDLEQVREWAADDPYKVAGLFASVTVAPLAQYYVKNQLDLGL